jgi:hypothetical protein
VIANHQLYAEATSKKLQCGGFLLVPCVTESAQQSSAGMGSQAKSGKGHGTAMAAKARVRVGCPVAGKGSQLKFVKSHGTAMAARSAGKAQLSSRG